MSLSTKDLLSKHRALQLWNGIMKNLMFISKISTIITVDVIIIIYTIINMMNSVSRAIRTI